jgi:hypothetical protein
MSGDFNSGNFRGGGNRARLGGHGRGRRFQGSSTAGRVGGDFDAGLPGVPSLTNVPWMRTMSRSRHRGGRRGRR